MSSLPKGWSQKPLGDAAEKIFSGGTPNTRTQEYWVGDFNWLASGETGQKQIYRTVKTITKSGVENSSTRLALTGDVVVATAGQGNTRGQVSYLCIDTYINQSIIAVRVNKMLLSDKWLFYNLSNRYKELRFISESNSVRGSITTKMLSSLIKLNLPPLPEQKAIADMLSSFDEKIELLREQNKTLETLAQTIFKEWFVNFNYPDATGDMVESELGLIPKGWLVKTIGELIELIIDYRGKTPKKLGMDWSVSGIPALSAKIIKKGKIVRRDAMNFGSKELYDIWMKDELTRKDILLTSEAPLGEMYYLTDDTKYILSQRLFALRVNKKITSEYLYHYLFSPLGQYLLQSRASGSTVEGIRQSELRKVEVVVPEQEVLNKASAIFASVFEKAALNDKQIQSLTKAREAILPKLMSGQVRVV